MINLLVYTDKFYSYWIEDQRTNTVVIIPHPISPRTLQHRPSVLHLRDLRVYEVGAFEAVPDRLLRVWWWEGWEKQGQ